MIPTCTRCPAHARWRDADGRHFCAGHVPANGKPLARMPAPPEPDIVDELEEQAVRSDAEFAPDESERFRKAAAEIRRLRALLDAG